MGVTGVLIIGSVLGVGRSVQLILSGWSGFGLNFCEEREPLDPSPEDEAYDHDAAVSHETSRSGRAQSSYSRRVSWQLGSDCGPG